VALPASLAVVWVALLIAAPALPTPLAVFLYAVGSRLCHQMAARSFHLFGSQLPVCARCLGIYAGGAIGLIAKPAASRRHLRVRSVSSRALLVAGGAPTAATLVLEWSGAWSGSNIVRSAAGLPLGAAVALVVAQVLTTVHYGRCAQRRPIASNRPPTPI
jgi:uncharacterized membrane protein